MVDIAGKQYEYQDLNLEDYDWLENWVRGKFLAAGRASLPEGLSDDEEERLMRPFIKAAMEVDVFNEKFSGFIGTLSGLVRVHWCSLRHKHPELTLNWVIEQCNGKDRAVMNELSRAKRELRLLIKEPKKSSEEKPKAKSRSTG